VRDILGNQLKLTIPAGTQPGTIMKLKSRGLTQRSGAPGDLLVQIQTSIPADIPNELLDLIKKQIDDYA
jgi:molecular chaperone DnaJ